MTSRENDAALFPQISRTRYVYVPSGTSSIKVLASGCAMMSTVSRVLSLLRKSSYCRPDLRSHESSMRVFIGNDTVLLARSGETARFKVELLLSCTRFARAQDEHVAATHKRACA